MLGFTYESVLLGPAIAAGVAQAGLYGLLAIALVLTYRVSRTVAFVHAGIAISSAMTYWWLAGPPQYPGYLITMPEPLALATVVLAGAAIGGVYGSIVTGRRLADWPKLTLTTLSLGVMLIMTGIVSIVFVVSFGVAGRPPSPFGSATYHLFGFNISLHQIITICIIIVLGVAIALLLARTRVGIYLRAIADDVEASRWVGVPLQWVGTGTYCAAGGIAALAGALIAPALSPNLVDVYFVFLRALSAAVIGGFNSFGLALAGALFFGVADSIMRTGLVGDYTPGQQEMVTLSVLIGAVVVVQRRRARRVEITKAEGM